MNQCKINNSLNAAVKEGKWGNPGAGFYNKLTMCHDLSKIGNSKESYDSAKKEGKIKRWQDFVSEAYLTCGRLVEGPHGECAIPFSKSGCKYPHHVFRDGELVVSIPGLKAAYSRAKQMGAFKGSIKEHLMRHYKELGLYDDSTMNIEESMDVTLLESYGEAVRRHIYDLTTDTLDGEKVDINNSDEFCPIKLSNIPNYMGINLCSVHSVEWSELTDGQLVDVTVKFNPAIEPDVMEERTICFPTVEDFEDTDKLVIEKNFFEITKSLSKYYPELMTQTYGGLPIYESSTIPSRVNTPEELSKWMRQNISYGWISKEDGKNHGTGDDDDENYFYKYYRLSSPEDTIKNETGVCWDTVEVERQWFKEHDIPFYIFYIELNDGANQPTHTFLMYRDQESKKYCWIDPLWMGKISQYDSPSELMKDVLKHHRVQHRDQESDCICRYLARRPKFGITCGQYMSYAHKSKLVNVDSEYFDEDYSIDLTGKSADEKITESFDWIEHFMEDTSFMESYSKAMDSPSVDKFMQYLNTNIRPGWVTKGSDRVYDIGDASSFNKLYRLQSPNRICKTRAGISWDICELERSWFTKHSYMFAIFFLEIQDRQFTPQHTFAVFYENRRYWWFEFGWSEMRGIRPYETLNQLLEDVIKRWRIANGSDFVSPVFLTWLTDSPKTNCTAQEYSDWAHKQKLINVSKLPTKLFNETYTMESLPEKLYFSSRNKHDTLTGRNGKLFLSPYIGISSMFIIDTQDIIVELIKRQTGSLPKHYSCNIGYDEWDADDNNLTVPLKEVHLSHNIPTLSGSISGESHGYIHEVNTADVRDQLTLFVTNDPNREVIYTGSDPLEVTNIIPHTVRWTMTFSRENVKKHGRGSFEAGINLPPPAEKYDPPYTKDEIIKNYGVEKYRELAADPAHKFRMDTGIELIHQEPTKEELDRICSNWQAMTDEMKNESDKMSMQLFGKRNIHHYVELLTVYGEAVMDDDFDWITKFIMEEGEDPTGNPQTTPEDENEPEQEQQAQTKEEEQTPQNDDPPPMEAPSEEAQPPEESPEQNQEEKEEQEPPQQAKPQQPTQAPQKESYPKQADRAEKDKNGVRRKKLYIAFIEWCKEYNDRNAFGSIFDKDAFKVSYPFVPDEMRYFYRLANPMLCVLGGDLTFFPVAELRKLNAKNKQMNELFIFAATQKDLRVFNVKDKKVYLATESNGTISLGQVLGDTFDIYIQNMIQQGDILNGPIETTEINPAE